LLDTDLVTPATRAVLKSRLEERAPASPRFFDEPTFLLLEEACARLLPPHEQRPTPRDVASGIDERLAAGTSDGWRYDALPSDGEAYRRGLLGLQQTARVRFERDFTGLEASAQDEVLQLVQRGEATGEMWHTLPARQFFEELLTEVAEIYYSHPLVQEHIGYVGMADGQGWIKVGLDQLDPHEPRAKVPQAGEDAEI